MKILLVVTAVLESGTGAAFLLAPSVVVSLLVGSSLETSTGFLVARVAGAALLALGIACWMAPVDEQGRAAIALIVPMLAYNVTVAALLIHARAVLELSGIGLWPAVVVHTALAVWCVACLRRYRRTGFRSCPNARTGSESCPTVI
jgi:hypothetical protein